MKLLTFLLSMLLLILPVSAFGDEDVLRLLIWEGYAPKRYVEEFEREIEVKYGRKVKMEISFVAGSDDFYNPVRDKSVDLITISHHLFKDKRFNFIAKKLLLPLDVTNIRDHTNVIPALQKADYHFSNGKVYGVPVAQGPYGLAYNTEMFKQGPQSWKIFWDPAFKNKYVIGANEYLYNANITALALGYPVDSINSYDVLNNNEFKKRLRQLVTNAHSFWIGQDTVDDLIGLSFAASWGDSLTSLKKRGEIWKMAKPAEGTPWWIDEYAITWALADRPFMKKVAEEWINKVLSPGFQIDNIVRELTIYPVVKNITDKLTDEENKRIRTSTSGAFMDKRILQHITSQRDRNGIKLLWDAAMDGISIKRGD
jgi:spermidine/putrescine transport system substrate-binding protein